MARHVTIQNKAMNAMFPWWKTTVIFTLFSWSKAVYQGILTYDPTFRRHEIFESTVFGTPAFMVKSCFSYHAFTMISAWYNHAFISSEVERYNSFVNQY